MIPCKLTISAQSQIPQRFLEVESSINLFRETEGDFETKSTEKKLISKWRTGQLPAN